MAGPRKDTLYVRGMPNGTTAKELGQEFENYGFVQFKEEQDAEAAFKETYDKPLSIKGDELRLQWAKKSMPDGGYPRGGDRGGYGFDRRRDDRDGGGDRYNDRGRDRDYDRPRGRYDDDRRGGGDRDRGYDRDYSRRDDPPRDRGYDRRDRDEPPPRDEPRGGREKEWSPPRR